MAQPGPSDSNRMPGGEHGVQLLLKRMSKQGEIQGTPPFSPFPPPAFANRPGAHQRREPSMEDFAGTPFGYYRPPFPVAPGPPQKIWVLEQEMIRMAQANSGGSSASPPGVQMRQAPMVHMHGAHPSNIRPIGSSPVPVPMQADPPIKEHVWNQFFAQDKRGPMQPPGGAVDRPVEPQTPAELSNLGLKQILGKVIDVMELESVLGYSPPSVRPPPGFENFPKPQNKPEKPKNWMLQKGNSEAFVGPNSPDGLSPVTPQWRKPSLDQNHGLNHNIDSFVGQPLITTTPLPVRSKQSGPPGKIVSKEEVDGSSRPTENFLRFWDSFTEPFKAQMLKKGPAGQENQVDVATKRLEVLDLEKNLDSKPLPKKGEEPKDKKKRNRKPKKGAKKASSAEAVEPPADNTPPSTKTVAQSVPNGGNTPNSKRPRRKSKNKNTRVESGTFEDYWDIVSVLQGLANGSLIQGEIRINVKNYKECYISHPTDKKDILINGTLDRNRAFEGDIVVVKMKDNQEAEQTSQSSSNQASAKVVHILKKVHTRGCVGLLTKIADQNYATLCPRDSRVPRLLIARATLPTNIIQNPGAFENILFKAKIISWDTPNFAQGVIDEIIGTKGDVAVETMAILKELQLDGQPVPEELSRYIPSMSITQEEIDRRLDLRKECIFTIDPETARDLDDALSFKKLGDDLFEVGVHISDVTHFLELGTPLDKAVSDRATSIYLVDRVIHMLPIELCMQCSLLPGQDKYAVSVIWKMDSEGNIKDTKFARTVVHSCAKLSYEHAQSIIEGESTVDLPPLYNNATPDMIRDNVLGLYKISKNMTKRRFANGALRIDQPKVCFRVNERTVPTEASLYELKDSNRMIEEFMLRANESVAEYIHSVHPKIALLRRHPPPKEEMMDKLKLSLATIGIDMDISSSGDIHKCISENATTRERSIVISALCARPMNRAVYFCNKSDTHHYALNVDKYTHFTSPIRRYADVVVHRVLCAILGYNELPPWSTYDVTKFCETSNVKKNDAKRASTMSNELFTALYIREKGGMDVEAIVQNVISHALDIIFVPLALNTRVYLDRLPAKLKFTEESANSSLTIQWNHAPDQPITYRIFSSVAVHLKTSEQNLTVEAALIPPVPIPEPTEEKPS